MDLLTNEKVLKSEIVANSTMNRERGLSGVNSYGRELAFDIVPWLLSRARGHGSSYWLDACCGEGLALMDARRALDSSPEGINVSVVGVDLVGAIKSNHSENVVVGDVTAFDTGRQVDLITCVHGIHYLGDKLGAIRHFYSLLNPGGVLICNVDLTNIIIDGTPSKSWRTVAGSPNPTVSFKKHILKVEKDVNSPIAFHLNYLGAAVSTAPNYTGIIVIDSFYSHAEPSAAI